jgi:transcriptional regulator with XRE-family HTH domain
MVPPVTVVELAPATDLDRLRMRMEAEAATWGALVKARRRLLHLSQPQLASLVGCRVQTISKVERGQIVLRDYLKAAIAVSLATEVGELFPWPTRRELAA